MLIGIEGELGGGKTLLMVRYLKKEHKENHRKILTNLELLHIPYERLDILSLLEDSTELNNVCVGIDELTVFVDCRSSSSRVNKFFSYIVLQSRKRNVDIYYTSQDLSMLEHRVTDHTNFIILSEKIYNNKNEEIKDFRYYTLFDLRNKRKPIMKDFYLNIKPYYKYYDTNQKIMPIYDFKPKKTKK